MLDVFVGRQAIYDRTLRVHAYELLYRSGAVEKEARFGDGDQATAQVLSDAFLEIGAQKLVGDSRCFVNLTERFLTGELPLPLPADRVVAEVLESVLPTPEVVEGVRRIKKRGARIALDDYVDRADDGPLLELADYVKVDLRAQDRAATLAMVEKLRPYGLKLLAEKVETEEELEFCKQAGFHFFQGFFLTRPEIVKGSRVPPNRVGLLNILSRLLDPEVDMVELSALISDDVSLAYKLLKYSNSSLYAPQEEIRSVQHGLSLLGLEATREIVSLVVLMHLDDRPGDLVPLSLTRAKMCESLAERSGRADASAYFTVGLFSTLDALTRAPMRRVLEHLPLSKDLSQALLHRKGPKGLALRCACAHESGAWEDARFEDLSPRSVSEAFLEATAYSEGLWKGMASRAAA